eukprot:SM000254S08794  [mRNA]  locus=s254:176038:179610:+ [translate_table: standard]
MHPNLVWQAKRLQLQRAAMNAASQRELLELDQGGTSSRELATPLSFVDQHTMQYARFKDHNIQMKPPSIKASNDGKVNSLHAPVKQTWGSCPEGTIPPSLVADDEVAIAGSLPDFFKKHPKAHGGGHHANKGQHNQKNSTGAPGNETLTAGMMKGGSNTTRLKYNIIQKPSYAGHEPTLRLVYFVAQLADVADKYLLISCPEIDRMLCRILQYAIGEYSGNSGLIYGTKATFDLWLVAGSYGNGNLNTIEAGWQLYPNNWPHRRLLSPWSQRDAYKRTGCYNLDCSGFVQTNGNVYLGGTVTPVSWYGSTQWEFTLLVFKNPGSGHWWLQYQVGYWPWWIFTCLNSHAEVGQWGGEIVNIEPYGRHTRTYMGSGWYAAKGWSSAAYIRNIQFVNQYNTLYNLDYAISSYTSNSNYIWVGANPGGWEAYFYFGGIGYSSICVLASMALIVKQMMMFLTKSCALSQANNLNAKRIVWRECKRARLVQADSI